MWFTQCVLIINYVQVAALELRIEKDKQREKRQILHLWGHYNSMGGN